MNIICENNMIIFDINRKFQITINLIPTLFFSIWDLNSKKYNRMYISFLFIGFSIMIPYRIGKKPINELINMRGIDIDENGIYIGTNKKLYSFSLPFKFYILDQYQLNKDKKWIHYNVSVNNEELYSNHFHYKGKDYKINFIVKYKECLTCVPKIIYTKQKYFVELEYKSPSGNDRLYHSIILSDKDFSLKKKLEQI
jgi:uncharacterized membrane protein